MNKIKYRAWEKNLKEMIEVEEIDFIRGVINGSSIWRFFDEIELMQYTGLKDKNGKEIYEGDILYHNEYYWLVKYGEYKYHTFGNTDITSYGLLFENYNFGVTDNFDGNWIVEGNIYENPNLLEEE